MTAYDDLGTAEAIDYRWADRESQTGFLRCCEHGFGLLKRGHFHYKVALGDSHADHWVRLYVDNPENGTEPTFYGVCNCRGYEFHHPPTICAHLWAVKRADQFGIVDIESPDAAFDDDGCPRCGQDRPADQIVRERWRGEP